VKDYVTSTNGRLRLFFLPGYSPELNPDEWVWKNVKNDRVAKQVPMNKAELKSLALGALRRLQKLPHIVRGFFADPHLAYIHA
jgi:transposase